jgi:hypothetical protein
MYCFRLVCHSITVSYAYKFLKLENCALLGRYAASSGNFLPTFRDNLSVSFPGVTNSFLIIEVGTYRGADKSLARPTFRCVLFDGENISFDATLVIYINSTNIPPIVIIGRIYEIQNLLSP